VKTKKIIITIEGGIVQNVNGIPRGTIIEVHDYDTDGGIPEEDDRLRRDKSGDVYHLSSWEK
jgi:hypothetical protein